jgi:flavodoxin
MNTLVIYDSQFGNTERIAKAMVSTLRAFGPAQALRVDALSPIEFAGVDLLLVGCPTQQFRPTPAMRAFLEQLSHATLSHLSVACFDTRVHLPWPLNGTAAQKMARQLRGQGIKPLVPPEGFFVKGKQGPLADGEVERATWWAARLHNAYAASHLQIAAS